MNLACHHPLNWNSPRPDEGDACLHHDCTNTPEPVSVLASSQKLNGLKTYVYISDIGLTALTVMAHDIHRCQYT